MRTWVIDWGALVRILIAAVLATIVLDVPAITRSIVGHLAVLFLLMAAFRSLIEMVAPSKRRLIARRTPPEA